MFLQGPRHGRSGLGFERGKMRRGLPGHSRWCTWGNCPQPDRLSRELRWFRALMPLSGLLQIQNVVLRCLASLCMQKLQICSLPCHSSWAQISSWSIYENPGEELSQDHLGCIRTTSSRWRDQETRNCWHKWQVPWQWVTSRRTSWTSSGWVESQHSRTRWWHQGNRRWRRSERLVARTIAKQVSKKAEQPQLPSNTHCPPKQGASAWPTFFRLSPMLTRGQPSCLSMGLVRMTFNVAGTSHDGRRR